MAEEDFSSYEILKDPNIKGDISFKIIIVGDSGVGKSCLSKKALGNEFEEFSDATIGFDFFTCAIKIKDTMVQLKIWDTCGQEIYNSLISSFYKTASLAILVYSITDASSFQHIDNWLKDIKSNANPDVKVILIGNKADLESNRAVSFEEGNRFSKENAFDDFFEASAKTGINAEEMFKKVALILYKELNKYVNKDIKPLIPSVFPSDEFKSKSGSSSIIEEKKSCCR